MSANDLRNRPLRIGALAARIQRSVHTIRWYEAQGLIPGVQRDPGGRRIYSERHVDWLELVERLRLTGMSIAQMREFAALVMRGRSSLKDQQALLDQHRQHVRDTIAEWTHALGVLDQKIDYYEEWLSTGQRPAKRTHEPRPGLAKKLAGSRGRSPEGRVGR